MSNLSPNNSRSGLLVAVLLAWLVGYPLVLTMLES